jgi:protocatechuate 3,4-dioxygenase beta subunit
MPQIASDESTARLNGSAVTDSNGKIFIRTILPVTMVVQQTTVISIPLSLVHNRKLTISTLSNIPV